MLTTRRSFLVAGLQVTASFPLLAALGRPRRGWGSPADGAHVLIVLQLTGGNDGLNTVIPHRQDAYFRLRPTLGQPPASLVAIDDDHGLHAALGPLRTVVDAGRLAVVHGVGYPHPDRSHFRSMEIWHTADPEHPPADSGWLGRLAEQISARDSTGVAALHVGEGDLPLALRARTTFAPSVVDPEGFRLAECAQPIEDERSALLALRDAQDDLGFLREAAETSYRAAERMEALAQAPDAVEYPGGDLARKLRLIARLVAGGFGTRVFHLELGGFDTHARQDRLHSGLLGQLAGALAAFDADLAAQGLEERVLTLVFSEFGRRAEENGSKGTDHGAGAPVLLLGGGVAPGTHGTPPDLDHLVDGDVPPTTDLRALYAALERDWMGLKASTTYAPFPVLRT